MSTIGNMMSYMLSTLVLAVFMFVLDWRLGLIAVIITLLASLVAKYMNKVSFKEAVGRQNQSENLTEDVYKRQVLSCGVFSIWVFGNFAPIFLNRESYMVMLTEGYGAEYAATLNSYMPMWIAPVLLVACFVFGLVGGLLGKAICKKHFQRAGIA